MKTSVYVTTEDMEEARKVIEETGRVVLCGPPGCGKTTLAHALLRCSQHQGFTPYTFTKVAEWYQHVAEDKKCVVLMDAAFGTVYVNENRYAYWKKILPNVLELTRTGSCRLIITVYPHVLKELKILDVRTESPFVDKCSVVSLMQNTLKDEVKTSILNLHLNKLHLAPDTQPALVERILERDISGPVFPWCCEQICQNWDSSEDPTHIVQAPAEAYVSLLQQMLLSHVCGDTVAAVLVLAMLNLGQFLLKPLQVQSQLKELGLSDFSDDQLERCAFFLQGSVLEDNGQGFASRVLYEAAGLALGRSVYLPVVLKVCDCRFFIKYVRTENTATEYSLTVKSERDLLELFVKRIYQEMIQGRLPEMSQHPCLRCPEILDMLKEVDETESSFLYKILNEDRPCLQRLLTSTDPQHCLPLLYWSSVSQSPALTHWCLRVMKNNRRLRRCLPHVLLALAVFHQHSDRYQQVSSPIKGMDISLAGIFKFPTNSVLLPLPKAQDRVVEEVSEVAQVLNDYASGDQHLCYLNNPSLPIPESVVSVRMSEKGVRVQVADRQHWYLVLRLLTDTQVDQVDDQGRTLLRQSYDSRCMEVVSLGLKAQLMYRFPHCMFFLSPLTDFIEKICFSQKLICRIFRYVFLLKAMEERSKNRRRGRDSRQPASGN